MISIIAAIGENNELGKDNKLIWHIKEDMQYFREMTMNKKVIMGLKTYLSLPGVLKNREYIVLSTTQPNLPNAHVFHDFDLLLKYLNTLDEEIMVIGGASIYKLFLPYADYLYLTEILAESEADAYFPEVKEEDFKLIRKRSSHENNLDYSFNVYEKRKKDEKR